MIAIPGASRRRGTVGDRAAAAASSERRRPSSTGSSSRRSRAAGGRAGARGIDPLVVAAAAAAPLVADAPMRSRLRRARAGARRPSSRCARDRAPLPAPVRVEAPTQHRLDPLASSRPAALPDLQERGRGDHASRCATARRPTALSRRGARAGEGGAPVRRALAQRQVVLAAVTLLAIAVSLRRHRAPRPQGRRRAPAGRSAPTRRSSPRAGPGRSGRRRRAGSWSLRGRSGSRARSFRAAPACTSTTGRVTSSPRSSAGPRRRRAPSSRSRRRSRAGFGSRA